MTIHIWSFSFLDTGPGLRDKGTTPRYRAHTCPGF